MTINDDLELSQQDRLQMFYSFVEVCQVAVKMTTIQLAKVC